MIADERRWVKARGKGIYRTQDLQAWVEENRKAIEAANRYFDEHGLWSDGLRQLQPDWDTDQI